MKKESIKTIEIIAPKILRASLTIEGLTSLIVDRRTPEKIKQKLVQEKNEVKIFEDCLYPELNGGHTIPSSMIKRSAEGAAHTFATSLTRTRARGAFFIPQDWIELDANNPTPRKDIIVVKKKNAIEIIRAEFKEWGATFPIEYDENGPINIENIIKLINIAGDKVGIGCWRPGCNGIHGRFRVVNA